MTTLRFQPQAYYNTLGPHAPVAHVGDGDTIITTTVDAFGNDERDKQVATRGNPQTGPFYVDGAEPGDILAVSLDRLYPNRDIGYTSTVLASNVVDPDFVCELPKPEMARWQINRTTGNATLVEPSNRLGQFTLPLSPMLGCFGVCPSDGQAISTATAGAHGGNMDYRGFKSGTTVYFPVFVPGALLFVGDGHATQGDGEISGTGIEISFDVQVTVHVIKNSSIRWPRGETSDAIFTVGNARPLDQALQHATTEMCRWLLTDYGLEIRDIGLLLGQCVEYDVGNVFDPAYTMVCKLAKHYLPVRERA
jgi:amidase